MGMAGDDDIRDCFHLYRSLFLIKARAELIELSELSIVFLLHPTSVDPNVPLNNRKINTSSRHYLLLPTPPDENEAQDIEPIPRYETVRREYVREI
jgi:hypothetical protein